MPETRKTVVVKPFTRVEGDLEVEIDVIDGLVASARASGTLYRGFERILVGRPSLDAIGIVPRVCGKCSLAHAAAAAAALRAVSGVEVPRNGFLSRSIVLGAEVVVNHVSSFYFTFAPDLAAVAPGDEALHRFTPISGRTFRDALDARREFLPVLGMFAGKWPNSLVTQPGGSSRPVDRSEVRRSLGAIDRMRRFLEASLVHDGLERWLEVKSEADLSAWTAEATHASSDLAVFVRFALDRGLDRIGLGPARFLSFGGWGTPERPRPREGFFNGTVSPLDVALFSEHLRYSWFPVERSRRRTSQPAPVADPDRSHPYSWTKAPRYAGLPVETGPLARQVIDGDPLVLDLVARRGASVFTRVMARLHELVRLVVELRTWIREIAPAEPFCRHGDLPGSGEGMGVLEAPRGALAHWTQLEGGTIHHYQIVTPTAWNFSPRDDNDVPGPVESALVGTPVGDERTCRNVLHVVKSFDPCLYCSTH
jgi:hydrogenase large subunit